MFSERLFEDILVKYPDLIESKLKFIGRQVSYFGKRIDILFEDRFNEKLIVELKKDNLDRNALSQVMEYSGYILSEKEPNTRVMIIANRIPLNLKKAMDHYGIEYKEITQNQLLTFLEKIDQNFFNAFINNQKEEAHINATLTENYTMAGKLDEILHSGGSWSEMIQKAENESKKRNGKLKYSRGVLNAHIKYRKVTQKNSEYLKGKIITSNGIFPKNQLHDAVISSRRGKIIELINLGLTDSEILIKIDQLFPPGHFRTSNKQAVYGTKRDLGL